MYSFQPLADIPASHSGFIAILVIWAVILVMALYNDLESFFITFFFAAIFCGFAYGASYHWTDQTTKTFANEKVVGKFVGYQPEGYNERSGKTRADKHYMYVVYEVDGGLTILRAEEGTTYPKETVLYKN